eukprot:16442884-Heterocapsa_arctica.AAC.1
MVKSLFPATEEVGLVIPLVAERVIQSPVLPTSKSSPHEPSDGGPPEGQQLKTHGKHDNKGVNPPHCEFFNVGSKEEDDEDTRTELQAMRRELQE